MLEVILSGEVLDLKKLESMVSEKKVSKRLKAPKQKIVDDMDGVLTALQRKMIRELLKHIDELERHIKNLRKR